MKTAVIALCIFLALGGFAAGYFPQHTQLVQARADLDRTNSELRATQQALRVHMRYRQLVDLIGEVEQGGDLAGARMASTEFFDAVRADMIAAEDPRWRSVLEETLRSRDRVTAGLARQDAQVREELLRIWKAFAPFLKQPANRGPAAQPQEGAPSPAASTPVPEAPGPSAPVVAGTPAANPAPASPPPVVPPVPPAPAGPGQAREAPAR